MKCSAGLVKMFAYKKPMVIAIWIVVMSGCGYLTNENDRTNLLVSSMVYFTFPLSVVILIVAWGASVCIFDKCLVPYEHKQILFLEEPLTPGFEIVMAGYHMFLFVGSVLTMYWVFFPAGLTKVASILPLLMYVTGIVYCPFRFWSSRHFFCTRIKRLIRRPEFADLFFADILTTFSKDLADLSTSICTIFSVWGWASTDLDSPESKCGSHSWLAVAVSISPFILRLIQCLASLYYADSEQRPRWWLSAVKQGLQIALIFLSRKYYVVTSQDWSDYYFPLWVGMLIAVSLFSICSDIFIDWNLRVWDWGSGTPNVTSQILTGELRWCYYGIIVLDIFLRVSWAWRLSDLKSRWIPFMLCMFEILRRVMWFPLRVEGWQVFQNIAPRAAVAVTGVELHGVGDDAPPPVGAAVESAAS